MNRNVWKNVSGVRAERFEKLYSCVNTHCAVHISIHMHWQPTKKTATLLMIIMGHHVRRNGQESVDETVEKRKKIAKTKRRIFHVSK